MGFDFDYSEEKDFILRESRQVGFQEAIKAISLGKLLDDISHPNLKKYPNQKIFIVEIKKYAYVVPYVMDKKRKVFFLKTVYASRKMTIKYLKRGGGK